MDLAFRGVTAIYGRPGAGKTSLAMRIAHGYLAAGKKVLWVSLYEDKETFLANAAKLGYDLSRAEFWDMIFVKPDVILNQIISAISQGEYHLVVADSLSALVEEGQSREWLINAVYRVFKPANIDFVGIAEEETVTPLDYIADNLIRLELKMENGVAERRMYVVKSRGRRAGYYVEFDILEGRGVVFIDELPQPRRRAPWGKWLDSLSKAFGPIKGGCVYLFYGRAATPLLAKAAAELSREGYKVLYRVFAGDPAAVASLIEKFGGRATVQRAAPAPMSHFAHVKSFYEALAETDADVVISDGVDVEFLVYGKKAFEINRFEAEELKRLGIALLARADRDYGLRYIADAVAAVGKEKAVVYTPAGVAECRYETQPEPRLAC
ncbi:RAD55 family ATPase [Pyrobaculum neutrophilum]|uniref:AAA ATPase n=1 Tax=Pyrobaculum neutrophilum (strain DSM 2338 / JCM 9278 / NBRC 100436 / V24Sta) TaxID=444157 RepID=B1YDZ9_PYRNV|nr:RAD55 family ATPase [Pyrobaculum neutrophilum]ACB40012.1 AAA ATPase [Pyrobaculum neutrophilum V24Sta]